MGCKIPAEELLDKSADHLEKQCLRVEASACKKAGASLKDLCAAHDSSVIPKTGFYLALKIVIDKIKD